MKKEAWWVLPAQLGLGMFLAVIISIVATCIVMAIDSITKPSRQDKNKSYSYTITIKQKGLPDDVYSNVEFYRYEAGILRIDRYQAIILNYCDCRVDIKLNKNPNYIHYQMDVNSNENQNKPYRIINN